jgi:hypothetical protein
MIDIVLWWSGLAAWIGCGAVGFFVAFDQAIELAGKNRQTRRDFIAFVRARLEKERTSWPGG